MTTRIEAIVAVHDPRRPLRRCVDSLLAQAPDLAARDAELRVLVVVHNTDLRAVVGALPPDPRVRVEHLADGIASPAGPFNHGLDHADADHVTTIGSDDVLEPGALAAWLQRGRATHADAVVAALRTGEGIVHTPYLRPGRRAVLDPVADGLAYRTAPLGLHRLDTLRRIGFRYTPGLAPGEDIEPGLRLWFRGGRITYPYGAPAYRVLDDMGAARVTSALRPLAVEIAAVDAVCDAEWVADTRRAERDAIATKLARTQLVEGIARRVAAARAEARGAAEGAAPEARPAWSSADAVAAGRAHERLATLSGTDLAALSTAETAGIRAAAGAQDGASLVAAWGASQAVRPHERVLPRDPRRVLAHSSRARIFITGQLAQRNGTFDHPTP